MRLAIAVTDVDAELARLRALVPAGAGTAQVGQAVSLPLSGSRWAPCSGAHTSTLRRLAATVGV